MPIIPSLLLRGSVCFTLRSGFSFPCCLAAVVSTTQNTAPWGSNRESYCHLLINRASKINGCLCPAPPINSKGKQDLKDPTQFHLPTLCAHLPPAHCWGQHAGWRCLGSNIPIIPSLDICMGQWGCKVPFGI